MTSIAVAEAKAHFSELLDRVSRGERFLVLRHGRPAAAIVPADSAPEAPPAPRGLLTLVGALEDWDDMDQFVEEIYAARRRAQDRPAPEFD